MPPSKTKKIKILTPELEVPVTPTHPLHHHRPIITLAIGLGIVLAISSMILANNSVRTTIVKQFSPEAISIDTTHWPEYTEPNTGLSFKYPNNWSMKTINLDSDQALVISSGENQNVKISVYISKANYLGFDGLPETPSSLNGLPAIVVASTLLGLERNGTYFTFDAGLHASSTPVFHALLKTVHFN